MDKKESGTFTRRQVLVGAGAALAAAGMPQAFASEQEHKHEHHGHGSAKHMGVIESTLHCIRDGEACLDHCIDLFKSGDTSVAKCAETVTEMLAMCTAMNKMASYHSSLAPELARICIKACEACEKECNEHADKHAACKACAKSCKDCIKACKAIAA